MSAQDLIDAEECGTKLTDECARRLVDWTRLVTSQVHGLTQDFVAVRTDLESRGYKLHGEKEVAIDELRTAIEALHVAHGNLIKAIEIGDTNDASKLYAKFVQTEGQINRFVRGGH